MTTKRREHFRRAILRCGPRWMAVMCCLAGACAAFWVMGRHLRVVTVTDTDSAAVTTLYAGTKDKSQLLQVSGHTLGPDDATVFTLMDDGAARLEVLRAFDVLIAADDTEAGIRMAHGTVTQALEKAGIALSGDDYTEPSPHSPVTEDMGRIVVHRVTYQERTVTRDVPFEVEYIQEGDPQNARYEHDILRSVGVNGQEQVTIRDRYVDGTYESSEEVAAEVTVEPINEVHAKVYNNVVSPLEAPEGITVTDNVPSRYSQVYKMKATGYYSPRGKGASGLGLYYGTFAVDPTLIPYGTKVYITSADGSFVYGWAIATDTGAFIHSNRMQVDLFYETYQESVQNGAKQVLVYVP